MRLVRLTPAHDRDRLLAIAAQDMSPAYRHAFVHELDRVARGTARGICALDDATPVGYAIYRRTVQTFALDTLAVERTRRGAGIGAALLDAVCSALQPARPTVLNAVTDAAAQDIVAFYLRHGFHLAGYVEDEFLLGVTQAHLTRELL